jgi:chromatin licensing and DNA replication factor 1
METKRDTVVRNLQFDMGSKSLNTTTKTRSLKSKRFSIHVDSQQCDIREALLKANKEIEDDRKVVFEKLGSLSPKKSTKRLVSKTAVISYAEERDQEPSYTKTPTKEPKIISKDMSLSEIKSKIITSARLNELRARIAKFKKCEDRLEKLNQMHQDKKEEIQKNQDKLKIKEFERLELEIPVSPQKFMQSPNKFLSPTKMVHLSPKASPARRLLFEPKEAPASPVKGSPVKTPAYQRYQSLIETEEKSLPLPYNYRFLAEIFRSIDTVSAMLFNRKEIITFNKLKPAVQELVRRTFTLDHLAQVKLFKIIISISKFLFLFII